MLWISGRFRCPLCMGACSLTAYIMKGGAVAKMDLIIPLAFGEIHVWLTFWEAIRDERLLAAYRELLSAAEKVKESRFYFARDRHRYLVTRALVRTVLSRYASIDPKDWVFCTNAYGCPRVVNAQTTERCPSFSVSHTRGLVILGIAEDRSLGVDVENFATSDISNRLADHFFAPQELAALHEVPQHQRLYRFLEYWTFKESYIKARGMGFSLPLDRFGFHFADNHSVDLVIDPELGDDSSRWQLWQFRPTPEHLLAVCAERLNAPSSKLLVRETIPTVSERILAPGLLRTSP